MGGTFDSPIAPIEIPQDYRIERVTTEVALRVFTKLIFGIVASDQETEEEYFKLFKQPHWQHWVVKNSDESVVATGSSLIIGKSMSFWNACTDPSYRRRGLSTALAKTALLDAKDKGCQIWLAYLAGARMAEGFLTKLGGRILGSLDIYRKVE
jgi:GNAT superfamily N-acetyltransferase